MKHAVLPWLTVLLLGLVIHPAAVAQQATKAAPAKVEVATQPGDAFLGDWEWSSGGEVFHLTLTRNPSYVFPEYPNDPPRAKAPNG